MQIIEKIRLPEPVNRVWSFFQQLERVARCIPGVESVAPRGDGNLRVRVTEKVGFISATFDLNVQMEEIKPTEFITFSLAGRPVRGAAGNVKILNRVDFLETKEGGTELILTADVSLDGMLGALGQRVVAGKTAEINRKFAKNLREEIEKERLSSG